MATLQQIEAAFLKADAAGDTEAAAVLAREVKRLRGAPQEAPAEPTIAQSAKQGAGNVLAGMVRGAGSIGATLLAPVDVAGDLFAGRGLSLQSNRERRAAMDSALADMGAETDSLGYGIGKVGAEVAGTLGVGGAVANVAGRAVPAALSQAIRAGGMQGGNLLTRTAGGGITGATSAALVNPEDAATGGVVGAALPGALRLAGGAGQAVGRVLRGPDQAPDLAVAVQSARSAGYVIPPTQARPTLGNRLLEGFSGKITTAQNASAKNQGVTNRLVAQDLGLPADTKLTPDVFDTVRRAAGQAYDAVASTGTVTPSPAYGAALDAIAAPLKKAASGFPNAKPNPLIAEIESLKTPAFDAAAGVEKIKELRELATTAYSAGDKAKGKALKSAANAIEDALDGHLQSIGAPPDLLDGFRESRKLIAKTYTAQSATNATTGSVDARKLAAQIQKGRPVSGAMRDAGEFAARFPKASQPVEGMGSLPQASPLDWGLGAVLAGSSMNPLMLLSVGARPTARALSLSPVVQNRLVQPQTNVLQQLVSPEVRQLGYRVAPVLAADQ